MTVTSEPTVLSDIFTIGYGQSLELNALEQCDDGVNFVSRSASNNGVTARVRVPKGVSPSPAGCLTVALGGSVLSTFHQPEPFVCGRDVAVLTPKDTGMSLVERLWWSRVIWANRWKYSYGRQANRTLAEITVPAEVPDWVKDKKVYALGFELDLSATTSESLTIWQHFGEPEV